MKTLVYNICALLLLVGCASPGSKVQVTMLEDQPRAPRQGEVTVYASEDAVPDRDYVELAELRLEGGGNIESQAAGYFREKAAALGADAIYMLENESKVLFRDGIQTNLTIYQAIAIAFE